MLPKTAKPGTVVDVVEGSDGWTLTVMKPVESEALTVKLRWKGGKPSFPKGFSLRRGAAAAAVKQDREDRDAKLAVENSK